MEPDALIKAQLLGLAFWLLVGVAFCFGAVALARSRRPRTLWLIWATLLLVLVVTMNQSMILRPGGRITGPIISYYMLFVMCGLPSAGVLAFAVKRTHTEGRLVPESLRAVVVFVALLPVAAIIAALPDIWRAFGV